MQINAEVKSEFSCLAGVPIDGERALFLLTADELVADKEPHVCVTCWDGSDLTLDDHFWTAVGTAHSELTSEIVVLGGEGELLAGSFGSLQEETQIEVEPEEGKSGLLRGLCSVGADFLIVGMGGQAYRRAPGGSLAQIDEGVPDTVDFESVSGFSANDAYAVGWKGAIWHHDGSRWAQVDSPTDLILTSVLCAPDGAVYACGQGGTLLKGRGDEWVVVEHEYHNEYFWSLAWFGGAPYVASNHLLLKLEGESLEPVVFAGEVVPFTFSKLGAAAGKLWSFGPKDVVTYDGSEWKRVF